MNEAYYTFDMLTNILTLKIKIFKNETNKCISTYTNTVAVLGLKNNLSC